MSDYFEIHEKIIGKKTSIKISESHIAVIGSGGLGCTVASGLIRLGIKNVTIIDGDTIEKSNIPRQELFTYNDVGKLKVSVVKKQLSQVLKTANIVSINDYFTLKNGTNYLKNSTIVIDCSDNFATRLAVSRVTEKLNVPMIYAGVDKFEGYIGVFNYKGSKPFHKTFPDSESLLKLENCASSGVLPFVVQIIGNYQIIEAFKILTNNSKVLNNQLLCINVLTNKQRIIKLK